MEKLWDVTSFGKGKTQTQSEQKSKGKKFWGICNGKEIFRKLAPKPFRGKDFTERGGIGGRPEKKKSLEGDRMNKLQFSLPGKKEEDLRTNAATGRATRYARSGGRRKRN